MTTPNTPKTALQENLLRLMTTRNLSANALARATKEAGEPVDRRTIDRLLKGTIADLATETAARIAGALGITRAELLGDADPAPPIFLFQIGPSPLNPRRDFDEAEIESLAASIEAQGLLHPLLLRRNRQEPGAYEIAAGERRWRALRLLAARGSRLTHDPVPAVVRELSDTELLTVALIENLERADLDALEEAEGYKRLRTAGKFSAVEIGKAIGRTERHVQQTLKLLEAEPAVIAALRSGVIGRAAAREITRGPAEHQQSIVDRIRDGTLAPAEAAIKNAREELKRRPASIKPITAPEDFETKEEPHARVAAEADAFTEALAEGREASKPGAGAPEASETEDGATTEAGTAAAAEPETERRSAEAAPTPASSAKPWANPTLPTSTPKRKAPEAAPTEKLPGQEPWFRVVDCGPFVSRPGTSIVHRPTFPQNLTLIEPATGEKVLYTRWDATAARGAAETADLPEEGETEVLDIPALLRRNPPAREPAEEPAAA